MSEYAAAQSYRIAFREWFGLQRAPADLLVALFIARGALVKAHDLARTAGVAEGAVQVLLVKVRSALDSEAVDCERGQGYRLTDSGMAECRGALRDIGKELLRASRPLPDLVSGRLAHVGGAESA